MLSVYGLTLISGYNQSGNNGKLIPFLRLRSKLVYDDLCKYANFKSSNWTIKKSIILSDLKIKKNSL